MSDHFLLYVCVVFNLARPLFLPALFCALQYSPFGKHAEVFETIGLNLDEKLGRRVGTQT